MKYLILLITLPFLLIITSCKKDDDPINAPIDLLSDTYNNIPVKVNTQNNFTFTVNAQNLTYRTEDELTFDKDSIVVTITLTNVVSSDGTIKLFDHTDNEIFTESLNNNKVVVRPNINGKIPNKITIDLVSFTGQLTFVVAVDKS